MCIDFGKLLYSGYEYGTRKLDLYGVRATEDEGHVVITATITGTKVSVTYLLDDEALREMGFWLDVEMHLEYLQDCGEARAARAEYDRLVSQFDHQWGLL